MVRQLSQNGRREEHHDGVDGREEPEQEVPLVDRPARGEQVVRGVRIRQELGNDRDEDADTDEVHEDREDNGEKRITGFC